MMTRRCGSVTRFNHPAVLRFPALAEQITELMGQDEEFAGICGDYAEIVANIAANEHASGHRGGLLADLLRLRADLESDIVEKLGEIGNYDT